tara:strand:- start:3701 stop:3961 length:261 start_codon:yes stop_codon:yes gene_type:complete
MEDYEDAYELESDIYAKNFKTPHQIMMEKWEASGRDLYKYLDSIPWDSEWLRHDTDEEKYAKDVSREYNRHPFKKFIPKPKEYIEL